MMEFFFWHRASWSSTANKCLKAHFQNSSLPDGHLRRDPRRLDTANCTTIWAKIMTRKFVPVTQRYSPSLHSARCIQLRAAIWSHFARSACLASSLGVEKTDNYMSRTMRWSNTRRLATFGVWSMWRWTRAYCLTHSWPRSNDSCSWIRESEPWGCHSTPQMMRRVVANHPKGRRTKWALELQIRSLVSKLSLRGSWAKPWSVSRRRLESIVYFLWAFLRSQRNKIRRNPYKRTLRSKKGTLTTLKRRLIRLKSSSLSSSTLRQTNRLWTKQWRAKYHKFILR